MNTGSSSPRSSEYAIPPAEAPLDPPAGETVSATGTHPVRTAVDEFDGLAPLDDFDDLGGFDAPAGPDAGPAVHGDPVGDLVRAAVADRPLDEVVDLITTLEQSPEYAEATVGALRAAGVSRSVEDVTRLVMLLTRPPRHPDSADEAIRAAAEGRPVEDVSRLMHLLQHTPLEPHCGQEAVRAAATGRPVEELVELIGRIAVERPARPEAPRDGAGRAPRAGDEWFGDERAVDDPPVDRGGARRVSAEPGGARGTGAATAGAGRADEPWAGAEPPGAPWAVDEPAGAERTGDEPWEPHSDAPDAAPVAEEPRDRRRAARPDRRPGGRDRPVREHHDAPDPRTAGDRGEPGRTAPRSRRPAAWSAWLTVAVLAGCGVAFFPLHQDGGSARAYGLALGLSALCLVVALVLTLRAAVWALAAAALLPAALAVARICATANPSARLSRAMDLTLAPAWAAAGAACLAALVALVALGLRLFTRTAGRGRPARDAARAAEAAAD
ncbi:hypothetical protein [Streptomyces sp. NPDC003717]|uniref:hypothetical protein n=1 Tax=Streptomyces sp. NPDC003717 TaxID=3154276 RepID=UPI0033A2616C